jgi:hypothetical protein
MELSEHITLKRQLAEMICQRLSDEINKLGFAKEEIKRYPSYEDASYVLVKDPYTGQQNLACHWYDPNNRQPVGKLQFNSDGTFYAEYDVVKIHPLKSKWFVEGVAAWGSAGNIKSEAKLLPMQTN